MNFENILAGIVAEKNAQETGTKPIDMGLVRKLFEEHYFYTQRFGLVRLIEKFNKQPQSAEFWIAVVFMCSTQFAWGSTQSAWEEANTICLGTLYNDD